MDNNTQDMTFLVEQAVKILLLSVKKIQPVDPKLMDYLEHDTEALYTHIKQNEGFTPLIVSINQDAYVFDTKHFVQDEISPVYTDTHIKINTHGN